MKRILVFETPAFTGATRVTRTIAKKLNGHFQIRTAIVNDIENPQKEILYAVEREKPNILFCSFADINPDVILIGKSQGAMVIVRQDYKLQDVTERTRRRIFETYSNADWIITQTSEMKQEFLSNDALSNGRIKVMENPLDEEDILKKAAEPNPFPDNGNFHFLWVGRKDPIKDLPTLHKAFKILHKEFPKTDLTLISDNPNPYKWMNHADCVVISSISEASPNVLREALFLGTKVISTNCSSTVSKLIPSDAISRVGDAGNLALVMSKVLLKNNN